MQSDFYAALPATQGRRPSGTARRSAAWHFFRRWLVNPIQVGSVVPSSPALCGLITQRVIRRDDEFVLELGAGTGVISRAMLQHGVPANRLIVVEIVPSMARMLRDGLPDANILEGDAWRIADLIPRSWHGRIGTVVCGIPLVLLPFARQRQLVEAIESVAPGRGFLHYSYCATSPIPHHKLGLAARRQSWTALNFPPASVWRYMPIEPRAWDNPGAIETTQRPDAMSLSVQPDAALP